jgi:hypothetical protein
MRLVGSLEGRRLTRGMLQHYTREGYVKPRGLSDTLSRRGRPCSVSYDITDIVLLRWLVRLGAQGVKLSRFAKGLRSLRKLMPGALKHPEKLVFFVVDRGDYALVVSHEIGLQLTGRVGQVVLSFSSRPDFGTTLDGATALASFTPASRSREAHRATRI